MSISRLARIALVTTCLAAAAPAASASAYYVMNGHDLTPTYTVWNACSHRVEVGAEEFLGTYSGWMPPGTVWARTWVHNSHNAVGQQIGSWSTPSGWAPVSHSPSWTFSPVYYPDEFQVQFYELSPYNKVMGNISVRQHIEPTVESYFSCPPPEGWDNGAWVPHW